MRKMLLLTCAVTALSGFGIAQDSFAQSQPSKSAPSAQPGTTTTTPADPSKGVRRVDGAAVVMTFYTANAADFRASKIMGKSVYNLNNESIGEVNDIIINDGKTIKAIVVGVGGFLGMGERNVAIDPASIVLSEQTDGSARMVVNTTRDDLKKAPAFHFADVDKAGPKAKNATTGSGGSNTGGTGNKPK